MKCDHSTLFNITDIISLKIPHCPIVIGDICSTMFGRSKGTEDIDAKENSSIGSEEPQSKSFMVGGGGRTVTLTIP